MDDTQDIPRRLDAVETHLAHQEATIQDLADVITRQADTIDALTRTVDRLAARLDAVEEIAETVRPPDPRPPHY